MTKTAIPADVMEAAEACYLECEQMDSYGIIETIARAIMAERERLASMPDLTNWQDISAALKTGEEIIGRCGPEWSGFSCFWDGEAFVHLDQDDGVIRYSPTEWMPMPGNRSGAKP